MSAEDGYIHGTHEEEQARLVKLNELLNPRSLAALGLVGGERVLDIGCGLGHLTSAMAAAVGPSGLVVGVDGSEQQIDRATEVVAEAEASVDLRLGDAHNLPLREDEWGTFDVAHARFVLEHVEDPAMVVRAMARALRPGGRLILEDDDHDVLRLSPPPTGMEQLWRAYVDTYSALGRDPFVGRHLVSLIHDAGARPTRNDWLTFGSCAGSDTFRPLFDNFVAILAGARESILARGGIDPADFDSALESFNRWALRPDVALWYATCWAEGIVMPANSGATLERIPRAAASVSAWSDRIPHLVSERSQLRLLVETAEDLTSTLDLDTVFERAAARVKALVDCQLFCLMLWNEETMLLEHSYSTCDDERVEYDPSQAFPLGYGVSGHAAARRHAIRIADVREDTRYVRFRHPEIEIRSELAVPLMFRDRLVGVLDLESTSVDAFSDEHERLLTALGSQIAIAVENARLFRVLRADEQRLEQDLTTARRIQRALLPARPPRLEQISVGSVCVPSKTLGGDFYDFLSIGSDELLLAIGDVSGKGTPAALYASMVVGMLRGQVVLSPAGPSDLLARVNEHLVDPQLESRFVALGLGLLDASTRTLTVANAGLPAPILLREGEARRVEFGGIPPGMLPGQSYEETRIDLRSGDVVVMFTDGLTDSVNLLDEPFSDHRLLRVLSGMGPVCAQEIADRLIGATSLHAGSARTRIDDRTVLVVCAE
jgi:serine phosphatase RsbU (regulator of sigma subunit)/ubiquinone/menaquinone biosynthesis C-methylase UbiE